MGLASRSADPGLSDGNPVGVGGRGTSGGCDAAGLSDRNPVGVAGRGTAIARRCNRRRKLFAGGEEECSNPPTPGDGPAFRKLFAGRRLFAFEELACCKHMDKHENSKPLFLNGRQKVQRGQEGEQEILRKTNRR